MLYLTDYAEALGLDGDNLPGEKRLGLRRVFLEKSRGESRTPSSSS